MLTTRPAVTVSTRGASSSAAGVARVRVDQLRHRMRGVELVRVRGKAEAGDRLEVGSPLFGLDDFAAHRLHSPSLHRQSTTMPSSFNRR